VDSWLRKGNVDESQSTSVTPAASVSAAVNPLTDMGIPDTADEVSIGETETSVGLDAPISEIETLLQKIPALMELTAPVPMRYQYYSPLRRNESLADAVGHMTIISGYPKPEMDTFAQYVKSLE
jgi:hypothetical protein